MLDETKKCFKRRKDLIFLDLLKGVLDLALVISFSLLSMVMAPIKFVSKVKEGELSCRRVFGNDSACQKRLSKHLVRISKIIISHGLGLGMMFVLLDKLHFLKE